MIKMRILDNRLIKILLIAITAIGLNVAVIAFANFEPKGQLTLTYDLKANEIDTHQLFYSTEGDWLEQNSINLEYAEPGEKQKLTYYLPKDVKYIRLDTGEKKGEIFLSNLSINYLWKTIDISSKVLNKDTQTKDIEKMQEVEDGVRLDIIGRDPFIVMDLTNLNISNMLKIDKYINYLFKVVICLGVNILLFIFIKKRSTFESLGKEVYNNRNLIWQLSKNDFKTKYAGSYLGITWAFVQPIVTVLVYWFVFQVGFRSAPIENFPFVLWLVAGIVPWFFFSEALLNATNSMLEYSYLVKKVVFKISILPVVKIISSLFVHIFFVGFTILLFMLYGYMPNIYAIQVVYYTLCMFVFVLSISYATSAIVIFFRDLGQIINIFMQVGMWMTPIMWSYNMVAEPYRWILKINPMYYIVEGYRDAFINHIWFWDKFGETAYFWFVAIGLFGIGGLIFKRLKIHFADVL